jgi:hypothetical protein
MKMAIRTRREEDLKQMHEDLESERRKHEENKLKHDAAIPVGSATGSVFGGGGGAGQYTGNHSSAENYLMQRAAQLERQAQGCRRLAKLMGAVGDDIFIWEALINMR